MGGINEDSHYTSEAKASDRQEAFACFAPLREIHGFVTAQLAKAAHEKAQSTQRKKPIQKLDSFATSLVEKEIQALTNLSQLGESEWFWMRACWMMGISG